jgi:hypothetical protein
MVLKSTSQNTMSDANAPIFDDLDIRPEDVFAKTLIGVEETRRQASGTLPPKLRTVLMLIDGRTPFDSFQTTLQTYGDVSQLFLILRDLGFIVKTSTNEFVKERHRQLGKSSGRSDVGANVSPVRSGVPTGFSSLTTPTQTPRSMLRPASQDKPAESSYSHNVDAPRASRSLEAFAQPQPALRASTQSALAFTPPTRATDLRTPVTMLCDVLTNELGFDGMDLMVAVERAETPSALRALLSDVEKALAPVIGVNKTRDLITRIDGAIP